MAARRRPATTAVLADVRVDPLLIGADRAFLESFPRRVVLETGALPLRRWGSLGLVVAGADREARASLARLQRESDVRLLAAMPLNEYGVELFLRYWDTAKKPPVPVPPIWMPDPRRAYLRRLGEMASIRGRAHPVPLLTSLILTSPLNHQCPILVARVDGCGEALFLGGAGGLRVGLRFPGAWHGDVVARLKLEFGMDGAAREGRGPEERGLNDLNAMVLPPLGAETLVLEPRGHR